MCTVEVEFPLATVCDFILDNYGTHKHPEVQQWLGKGPRLNYILPRRALVRRISRKVIRRGAFGSVDDLETAVRAFLVNYNDDAKSFFCTTLGGAIMQKLEKVKFIYGSLQQVFYNGI